MLVTKSEPNRNRQISKLKEHGDEGVFNSRSKEVKGALKKKDLTEGEVLD